MTNYIWDSSDYPWGDDPGLDILKIEYDKLKEDERTSALIGTTPPSYQQKSSEVVDLMKKRATTTGMPLHTPNLQNSFKNLSANDTDKVMKRAEQSIQKDRPRINPSRFELSENLDNHIRHHEGYRADAYKDTAGNLTIGIGHKVDNNEYKVGDIISHDQIMQHYSDDKEEARQHALKIVGDLPMHRYEFEAIVDAVYNVGPGNLGLGTNKSPNLNAAIKAGDYPAIENNLMYSKDSDGNRRGGLIRRSDDRKNHYKGIYRKY